MSADLLSGLLAGYSSGGSNPYASMFYQASENPLAKAAVALPMAAQGLYNPYNSNTKNIATAGLTGLAGALLSGFAQRQTANRNEKLLEQALALESAEPGEERAAMVKSNPRLAPLYGQLKSQEAAAEKARLKAEMEAPKTRTIMDGKEKIYQEWSPVNRQWTEVGRGTSGSGLESLAASNSKIAAALLKQQDGIGMLGQTEQDRQAKLLDLAERAEAVAKKIGDVPANYFNTKGAQFVSALDEYGIGRDLSALEAEGVYTLSGAQAGEEERKAIQKFQQGDYSAGPQYMQKALENFAKDQYQKAKRLQKYGRLRQKPEEMDAFLEERIEGLSTRPGYGDSSNTFTENGVTYKVDPITKKITVIK